MIAYPDMLEEGDRLCLLPDTADVIRAFLTLVEAGDDNNQDSPS